MPTPKQLLAYKLRMVVQLADNLVLHALDSTAQNRLKKVRRGLNHISDTIADVADELHKLEPEESVLDGEFLANLEASRSASPLARS